MDKRRAKSNLAVSATASIVSVLAAIAVFSFMGCGRKPEEKSSRITLKYMLWGSGKEMKQIFNPLKESFEEDHPNIKIRIENCPQNYGTKLQTMLASGTAPDLFDVTSILPKLAKYNVIMDIQRFVDRDINVDDYYPQMFKENMYKGRLYGIPDGFYITGLYYNKDMFDEAGLSYPDDTWTWDDLLKAAKKLTKDRDGDGKIDQWGFLSSLNFQNYLVNFVRQNGGEILNEDRTKCLIDQPEAVEAVQFLVDLVNKHKVSPTPGQQRDMGDIFQSGKIAMVYGGSWQMVAFSKIKDFRWGVAPLAKKKKRAACGLGGFIAINAKTKHPEEAWEFVKFYLSEKQQRMNARWGRCVPSLKSVAQSKHFIGDDELSDNKQVFVDELEYCYGMYYTENWSEWLTALNDELSLSMLGRKSVKEACKEAAKKVNKLLREVRLRYEG